MPLRRTVSYHGRFSPSAPQAHVIPSFRSSSDMLRLVPREYQSMGKEVPATGTSTDVHKGLRRSKNFGRDQPTTISDTAAGRPTAPEVREPQETPPFSLI